MQGNLKINTIRLQMIQVSQLNMRNKHMMVSKDRKFI